MNTNSNSNQTIKTNPPAQLSAPEYANLIPTAVKIGEEDSFYLIPNLSIKLLEVKKDGRCPTGVNCFQAGAATIVAEARFNGKSEQAELRIPDGTPSLYQPPQERNETQGSGNFIAIDQYKIFFVYLDPYPDISKTIQDKEYEAVFLADTLKSLDWKNEMTRIAIEELKRQLPDQERYWLKGITTEVGDAGSTSFVTFVAPTATNNVRTVTVTVGVQDGEWKAVDFSL